MNGFKCNLRGYGKKAESCHLCYQQILMDFYSVVSLHDQASFKRELRPGTSYQTALSNFDFGLRDGRLGRTKIDLACFVPR